MLIATQTPDYNDPPELDAWIRELAGPVGGTLLEILGNPSLLRQLWLEVRMRIVGPEAKAAACPEIEQRLRQDAVDVALDRLIAAGEGEAWIAELEQDRRKVRAKFVQRSRENGYAITAQLLLYCGHPEFNGEQRLVLLQDLMLGGTGAELDRSLRKSVRTGFDRNRSVFEFAQERQPRLVLLNRNQARVRLPRVLEAIRDLYLLELAGTTPVGPAEQRFGFQALWLARKTLDLFPSSEKAKALHAELLLLESRHRARWRRSGGAVHLEAQDRELWDRIQIRSAEMLLDQVSPKEHEQVEALRAKVQLVHARARSWEATDWGKLIELHRRLEGIPQCVGAGLGTALAVSAQGPRSGLKALERLRLASSDPRYLALRAALLGRLGEVRAALQDLTTAERLTPFAGPRVDLAQQRRELEALLRHLGWGGAEATGAE